MSTFYRQRLVTSHTVAVHVLSVYRCSFVYVISPKLSQVWYLVGIRLFIIR